MRSGWSGAGAARAPSNISTPSTPSPWASSRAAIPCLRCANSTSACHSSDSGKACGECGKNVHRQQNSACGTRGVPGEVSEEINSMWSVPAFDSPEETAPIHAVRQTRDNHTVGGPASGAEWHCPPSAGCAHHHCCRRRLPWPHGEGVHRGGVSEEAREAHGGAGAACCDGEGDGCPCKPSSIGSFLLLQRSTGCTRMGLCVCVCVCARTVARLKGLEVPASAEYPMLNAINSR